MAEPELAPCLWCFELPDQQGPQFDRCSRCKSARYCSKLCQRKDWKQHKGECKAISEGSATPKPRASISFTAQFLANTSTPPSPGADVVYFLKTTKPGIRDVSVSGPYHPLDAIAEQFKARLVAERAIHGFIVFEEALENVPITAIERLNTAIPNGGRMSFQIIRHSDPNVASYLRSCPPNEPRSVYAVLNTIVDTEYLEHTDRHPDTSFVPLRDADVHAVFTRREAANRSALHLLEQWKEEISGATVDKTVQEDGTVVGFLMQPAGTLRKMVVVHLDDGSLGHNEQFIGR